MTPEDVLTEFSTWLDDWPDCEARRWVEDNLPTVYDAALALTVLAA